MLHRIKFAGVIKTPRQTPKQYTKAITANKNRKPKGSKTHKRCPTSCYPLPSSGLSQNQTKVFN